MKRFGIGLGIVIAFILFLILILPLNPPYKYKIVTTTFPAYDFARAIVGEENTKMVLPPGVDIHNYEPTPIDLAIMSDAGLIVYIGGESDNWLNDIVGKDSNTLSMMEILNKSEEDESSDGEPTDTEPLPDEHVWTSLKNSIKIINGIVERASEVWPKEAETFRENADNYISDILQLDKQYENVVKTAKRKTLVFGDRFPLYYFVKDYGLKYEAAFTGCAEETEPSASDVKTLIDKVNAEHIPVVLKLEMSDGKIAETIAEETGARVLEYNSAHNISQDDFERGTTYVDIMRNNLEILKEALK